MNALALANSHTGHISNITAFRISTTEKIAQMISLLDLFAESVIVCCSVVYIPSIYIGHICEITLAIHVSNSY